MTFYCLAAYMTGAILGGMTTGWPVWFNMVYTKPGSNISCSRCRARESWSLCWECLPLSGIHRSQARPLNSQTSARSKSLQPLHRTTHIPDADNCSSLAGSSPRGLVHHLRSGECLMAYPHWSKILELSCLTGRGHLTNYRNVRI